MTLLARGQRADFLRIHGVTLTGLANFTVPVVLVTDPRQLKDADVLIVAVKTYDTETALDGVRHLEVKSVLSVQNGVYKNEQLMSCFGPAKTLGATAMFSGEVLPDSSVRFTMNEGLYIGELPEGISARVEALAAVLNGAGIRAVASPEIQSAEWSKYVVFVASMVLAALARLETYKVMKDADLAYLRVILVKEIAGLAARLHIPLGDYGLIRPQSLIGVSLEEAVVRIVRGGQDMESRGATAHKISTLQDLERGRRMEVEEILGYAVRKGKELGVQLPTVEFSYRLLSGINHYLK